MLEGLDCNKTVANDLPEDVLGLFIVELCGPGGLTTVAGSFVTSHVDGSVGVLKKMD